MEMSVNVHWFPVPGLLEDLGRHVPRRATRRRQDVELLLVHDPRQTEVRDQQVRIVLRGAEQEVLGLEVAVHDAVVVQVGDGGEHRADEVCGVGLVVAALAADAVEELSPEREIGDEVDCRHQS